MATAYQPDDVWSFEGGEKARLFDRHVTINGSVYYENWNHIQQSLADNTCGYDYSDNAGDAHIYGAELETSWRVTPEITLGNSLGYTNATLSSVTAAAAADGFTVGQRVQEVPEWTDTASLVYTHRLNEKYNIVARATNEYVGDQTTIVYTTYVVPSYDFVNLRVGLDSKQAVSAWLFMNNATNAHTPINIGETITVFVPEVNRDIVPQPRTVGVELDYAFGGR